MCKIQGPADTNTLINPDSRIIWDYLYINTPHLQNSSFCLLKSFIVVSY
jgi:hypothetical protein